MTFSLTDTHCHLYLDEFNNDSDEMIQRALNAGISKMYLPAIDSHSMQDLISLENRYPSHCFAMTGLHPCYVKENFEDELDLVKQWLHKRSFVGIGECGLDFYWDKTFIDQQYLALEKQAEWAIAYDLPIILHTRNATQETIDVMRKFQSRGIRGIFHCFGGTIEEAQQIMDMGFYLGIGGVVTYKNAGLDKVLEQMDLNHVVLETDAPYLSPVPHRGKRNETSYLIHVAEKIAQIKGLSLEEVARITTENANRLFEKQRK